MTAQRDGMVTSTSVKGNRKPKMVSVLLGSLFVKEPSSQALNDYQKSQFKSAGLSPTERKSSIVTLPGVSTAKLPPNVPKVNSKWDGIPQPNKKKESRKSSSGSSRQWNGTLGTRLTGISTVQSGSICYPLSNSSGSTNPSRRHSAQSSYWEVFGASTTGRPASSNFDPMKEGMSWHNQSAHQPQTPPTTSSSYNDMMFLSAPSFMQSIAVTEGIRDGSSSHTSRSDSYIGSSSSQSLPRSSSFLTPACPEAAPGGYTEPSSSSTSNVNFPSSEKIPLKSPYAPRVFHPPATVAPWEFIGAQPTNHATHCDNDGASPPNTSLVKGPKNKLMSPLGSSEPVKLGQNQTMPRKAGIDGNKRSGGRFRRFMTNNGSNQA